MYSVSLNGPFGKMRESLNLQKRLEQRRFVEVDEYLEVMKLRERTHSLASYKPIGSTDDLFPGTYYLAEVDSKKRRKYELKQ